MFQCDFFFFAVVVAGPFVGVDDFNHVKYLKTDGFKERKKEGRTDIVITIIFIHIRVITINTYVFPTRICVCVWFLFETEVVKNHKKEIPHTHTHSPPLTHTYI